GLEDPPAVAAADPIENHVAAHDQAVSLVPQESIGLERRQDLIADQPRRQGPGLARVFADADLVAELLELPVAEDPRTPDQAHEVLGRGLGRSRRIGRLHASISPQIASRQIRVRPATLEGPLDFGGSAASPPEMPDAGAGPEPARRSPADAPGR